MHVSGSFTDSLIQSWTIVEFQEGDPSLQYIQAIMLWDSVESFEKGKFLA